jgi:PKD repeat protein
VVSTGRGALGPKRSGPAALAPLALLRGLALLLGLALLPALAVLLPASAADAELTNNEYHEVTRFGGLDETAFIGGKLTPGKFVEPTGFAVDPTEGEEAIYVADRTSRAEGVEGGSCDVTTASKRCADWRIQKLSPTGAVLGTTMFTLPVGVVLPSEKREAASMIAGLAVDHTAGRLYALVMGPLGPADPYSEHATAAQELLAWSTTPGACSGKCETGGPLKAATGEGIGADPLGSKGGLVSSQQQLDSGKSPLYDPQGIVVDHLGSPGIQDPVAIEATNLNGSTAVDEPSLALWSERIEYFEFQLKGDTVVQQVATQKAIGPKGEPLTTGGLRGEPWTSASVASQVGASRGPLGIFDDPDGHISVLLHGSERAAGNADLVRLGPDLSKPEALTNETQESQRINEATMFLDAGPFFNDPGEEPSRKQLRNGPNELWGAGPEATQLSSGLYASDVYFPEPNCEGNPGYWHTEEIHRGCGGRTPPFVQRPGANIGVRLLAPGANGLISDPQGRTILDTLGDEHLESIERPEPHSPCEIGAQDAALAAGAQGALWVFDRGPTAGKLAESPEEGEWIPGAFGTRSQAAEGREIIELAPGEGSPSSRCPKPSGTFAMSLCGSGSPETGSLHAPVGAPITFDASPVDLAHGTPFAYRWEFGDGSEGLKERETHSFSKPGTYQVVLSIRSDFGEYVTSATVQVEATQASALVQAQFTRTSPNGARQAIFDASGSSGGVCDAIYDYHWEWGDGKSGDPSPTQDFQKPVVEHTFPTPKPGAGPKTYTVWLTVINAPGYERASVKEEVEVSPPQSFGEGVPETPLLGPPKTQPGHTSRAPARGPTHVSPRARFSRGALGVTVSCPQAKVLCAGEVQVKTAAAFPVGVAGSGKAKRGHRRSRLAIGSARFSLTGGASATVAVHVKAAGSSLLARLRRLPVLVTVSAHDPLGDVGVDVLRLTLSRPRR